MVAGQYNPKGITISVKFDGKDWRIDPDHALVKTNTAVRWKIEYDHRPISKIRWRIYFDHGSPLKSNIDSIFANRVNLIGPASIYTARAIVVVPGDYKYGIQAIDNFGNIIGDEDPFLMVTA